MKSGRSVLGPILRLNHWKFVRTKPALPRFGALRQLHLNTHDAYPLLTLIYNNNNNCHRVNSDSMEWKTGFQSCHCGTSPQNILVSFHHHHVLSVSQKCSFFVQTLLTKCVFIRASLHLWHFAPGDDSSHSWFLTSYSVVKTLHIVFSISFSCIRERQQTRLEILSEAINMTLTAWEHLAVLGLVYIYPTLWSCYTFILIGENRQHER